MMSASRKAFEDIPFKRATYHFCRHCRSFRPLFGLCRTPDKQQTEHNHVVDSRLDQLLGFGNATEPDVIATCADFAFSTRADHVAGTVLFCT